jgi:intracellular multiplication protein IcmP
MSGGSGGNRVDDAEITLVLMAGLFFVLCWGIWVGAKQPLMEFIRGVKWVEVTLFQLVDPAFAEDRKLLESLSNNQVAVEQLDEQASKVKKKLKVKDYTERGLLSPDVLWGVSNRIGGYTRFPIAAFFIGLAIFYMFFSKRTKFRTAYDLEGLIKLQAKQWPVVTPIVNFDPALDNARSPGEPVPAVLPIFAEALSPEEWVAFHRISLTNKVPDKDAARRALLLQLGPRWTGLGCMTLAQRCIFAACSLKGAQKRKESDALLGRIALAWDHKSDFNPSAELMAEVNAIINNPKYGDEAFEIAKKFAYRTTALLGVLKWARSRGGVLAPAAFLWLRGHDRDLWYPLNNLGRRSYHAEAMGAMAHFMAESTAGRPLPIPRLETALLTLNQYWSDSAKHVQTGGVPKLPALKEGNGRKKS